MQQRLGAGLNVFDGVLDARPDTATESLTDFQASCDALGSTHWLYDRSSPNKSEATLGVLEIFLEQLLTSLNDDAPFVELWHREDWMVLDAHRDVDEILARRADESYELRCPVHAHVLYIDIGLEVRGPTCLWLESAESARHIDTLITVPARSGRLLRFPGDAIHSVPRPTLCYLDPENGGSNVEIHSRKKGEVSNFPELRRSVLLFNTWFTPPAEVMASPRTAKGKEGTRSRLLRPRQDWTAVPTHALPPDPAEGPPVHLKLGVLGNRKRRFHPETWIHLYSPSRGVKAALEAEEAVHSVALCEGQAA